MEREVRWATTDDTRDFGRRLGALLRGGDLLVLTGDLGAGKTTLTQGIAEGLGVRGPITSPTFVIALGFPSLVGGPVLLHVDAYRVGSAIELADLDLDAEQLSEQRLELTITGDDVRTARLVGVGERWSPVLDAVVPAPGRDSTVLG